MERVHHEKSQHGGDIFVCMCVCCYTHLWAAAPQSWEQCEFLGKKWCDMTDGDDTNDVEKDDDVDDDGRDDRGAVQLLNLWALRANGPWN